MHKFWIEQVEEVFKTLKENNKGTFNRIVEAKTGLSRQVCGSRARKSWKLETVTKILKQLDVIFTIKITEDTQELIIHHIPHKLEIKNEK